MSQIYETKRLILKSLTPVWADSVLDFYLNNKYFFEPWEPDRQPNFYTLDFQKKTLQYDETSRQRGTYLRLWIFTKEDSINPIGTICFQNITRSVFQSCVVGYKISQPYTRMGYCEEALMRAIQVIFMEYRLHRIEAYVHTQNIPSIFLIEKIGFQREGIKFDYAKLGGTWQNHYCYSLINPFH